MNQHTYLLCPGKWKALGFYWDESGAENQARGETVITHSDDFWFLQGGVEVLSSPPVTLAHQYEITPFIDNFPSTVWVTHDETIGKLNGVYTIVRKAILSNFNSEDNQYAGFEFFMREDDETYRNEGAFYRGRRRLSSWAVTLKKTE